MALKVIPQLVILSILVVSLALADPPSRSRYRTANTELNNFKKVSKNLTALWTKVNEVSKPISVHVHDTDPSGCDSYFGCDYSHAHGSHAGHKNGSHGSHGSHGHHHGTHPNDNHLHIHLTVNNKDDCGFVTYKPKDEFVYARCDMIPQNKQSLNIKGHILMRQKPHKVLETLVKLDGFDGPSEGTKDGKHDFFYDVHEFADFADKCNSFGGHDHKHGEDDGHAHSGHAHSGHDHSGHDHSGHDHSGHDHSGHNHDHKGHDHSHSHGHDGDNWGNIIINRRGRVRMEANCTHQELFGPGSMMGRGIVLHDKDDKTVACCAITYANIKEDGWKF